jgi:phosphopantothenoylcysteine decarboxylase / phosphopantothenate---cysteine ligase
MLKGKRILLGVTGSIAAYKAAIFVRLLVKEGAEVKVVMTKDAQQFISALTLSTLSKHEVLSDLIKEQNSWSNHVELGLWADLFIIAPASANSIAKFAHGICDNLLTACYLSCKSKVMIAPAMDLDMYKHPSTVANLKTLKTNGNIILESKHGELASGLVGEGRMQEPEELLSALIQFFNPKLPLSGKKVLVNAGPTYESIDPVRFIGNRSTGKMGIAIAEYCALLGANVTLVLGPSNLPVHSGLHTIRVESAEEMANACKSMFKEADISILSAAVADYKPSVVAPQKIKKSSDSLQLDLTKTTDILKSLGQIKTAKQVLVGFALETENELENAKKKIEQKQLDWIVLNSLNDSGAGFGHDTNKIRLIHKTGKIIESETLPKTDIAKLIVDTIISHA